MNIKNLIQLFPLFFLPFFASSQDAAIMNTNMQIYASLNKQPVAWATNYVEIHLNKQTGELVAILLVDNLGLALTNPDYDGGKGENRGKFLTLTGRIPVLDVLDLNDSKVNLAVELMANFNGIDYPCGFTFSILRMRANDNKGFSVMSEGSLSISKLEITSLKKFDDELKIRLSFTGF